LAHAEELVRVGNRGQEDDLAEIAQRPGLRLVQEAPDLVEARRPQREQLLHRLHRQQALGKVEHLVARQHAEARVVRALFRGEGGEFHGRDHSRCGLHNTRVVSLFWHRIARRRTAMNDSVHTIPLPTPKILAKKGDGIGWITFNQPEKRNAISMAMWDAVGDAAELFGKDDTVRVVVLSGAGGKAFASGADISEFAAARASAEDEEKYHTHADNARTALRDMGKPIIAMIQGFCIGGGAATALLADLRIATPESKFGVPAAKLGVAYALEGLHRLVALVGPSVAKEIMFTGRQFTAAEALA